jgi:hypothetical protein
MYVCSCDPRKRAARGAWLDRSDRVLQPVLFKTFLSDRFEPNDQYNAATATASSAIMRTNKNHINTTTCIVLKNGNLSSRCVERTTTHRSSSKLFFERNTSNGDQ